MFLQQHCAGDDSWLSICRQPHGLGRVEFRVLKSGQTYKVCITTNPLPAACVADGITLGSCAGLRFRPPTTANAGTSFSLFDRGWAENYSAPGSLVGP